MRNETVQAWLLGKLVHEGLDAPPTGADRNAMNEFIRCVTKDAGYKYQAGGEHKPSVWVQNYPGPGDPQPPAQRPPLLRQLQRRYAAAQHV